MSAQPSYSISTFTKNEVDQIYKQTGKRIKTEWFDLVFAPKNQEFARLLVVTSKKIGNAPKRNKLKRRLKSIFFESNFFNANYDCILIAKKPSVNLSFNQLKDLFVSLYKNKILNENIG